MLARSPRGRRPPSFAAVVACAMLPACAAAAAPTSAEGEKALHAWEGGDSPAALEAWVQEHLRRADADVARVLGVKGARSVANTLRPYDDAVNELLLAVSQSSVIYGVGATRELRDKAQSLTQTANAAYTALNLNQGVYRALAALPSPADGATRHYLEHSLLEYRLAGVDRDEATRAKIKALQDKITALGLSFERAVHDDVRTTVADQMIGSPAKLAEYLAGIDAASREPGAREDAALLSFARERDPSIQKISYADLRYWQEQYRRARFNFDSQSVRPYFPYAGVERGVITTASRLFHIDIRPVSGVRTWHPSVTTYDVYDGPVRLGRIYLDMHPREGKDKWFSTQPLAYGVHGRQLPEAVLVCNFTGGTTADPGLMQYGDVVVFLHEFGHLMHHVIGGQNAFAGEGAFLIEGDFVEAPSQMLEEFFHDYGVLSSFAPHYHTGEVLPRELFARTNRADAYGRASGPQRQLMYTSVSLDFHTLTAATLDFDAAYRRDFERFNSAAFIPGDHFWASFTH